MRQYMYNQHKIYVHLAVIFEGTQLMAMVPQRYNERTDGRTNGQTDDLL